MLMAELSGDVCVDHVGVVYEHMGQGTLESELETEFVC
jgi:hypothetical protein